jgi:hypothetical protein
MGTHVRDERNSQLGEIATCDVVVQTVIVGESLFEQGSRARW